MSENTDTAPRAQDREPRSFVQRLLRLTPTDILRLLFLCVLVGFLLAAFGVNPRRLWVDFFGSLVDVFDRFLDIIAHSAADLVNYLLLGAVIVVPIWLVFRVLGATRRD